MQTSEPGPLLRADRAANRGNPKGFVIAAAHRVAHRATTQLPRWQTLPILAAYRLLTEVIFGVELPAGVVAGPGLQIWHGTGLVVHSGARLGANVVLRHNTTIGARDNHPSSAAPVLGDRVNVGAGAIIIGDVHVGDDATVGAGAVVVGNVPVGATVVGNPARVVAGRDSSQTGTGT